MKVNIMKLILSFLIISFSILNASGRYETSKTTCVIQSNYPDTTLNELKKILIDQSKQEALEELYGNVIYSKTEIKDGKLISDEIRSRAIGAVRVSGNPRFYNGQNLGEVCADLTAYITKADLKKYSPKEITLKHYCYTDKTTAIGELKNRAKENAYIAAIVQVRPSLKEISFTEAEKLIHGFTMRNEKFDISASAYCFDAVAKLIPYELEMLDKKPVKTKRAGKSSAKLNHGLKVTYYEKNDVDLLKPLYSEVLRKNTWLKNKKIANAKLKSNKIYRIHIEGYFKTGSKRVEYMKLIQDVYSVKIKLDDKEILTDKRMITKADLKPYSLHKLDVMLKTVERFDIALLAKNFKSDSYQPIESDKLFYKKGKK